MAERPHEVGDVLLLEHTIPGIPYPSGIWVLLTLSDLKATVSLCSEDAKGLYGIDNPYEILREDLAAFTFTGQRGRTKK